MTFEEPWRSNLFEVFQMSCILIFGFELKAPFILHATALSEVLLVTMKRGERQEEGGGMGRIDLRSLEGPLCSEKSFVNLDNSLNFFYYLVGQL